MISIGAIFLFYPLILFINAALLIFRHSYYKNYGVDPLFICGFCPIYQRYSSPNGPHLSSVLDPNNLYLFNNNISPSISPNRKQKQQMVLKQNDDEETQKTNVVDMNWNANKIGIAPNGLSIVDEEEFYDEHAHDHSEESVHSMVEEPEQCMLPRSDSDDDDDDENKKGNKIDIDGKSVSDVDGDNDSKKEN